MSDRASKIETGTVAPRSPVETTGSPATSDSGASNSEASARHRPTTTGVRRSFGAIASFPLILVSTIAIVLNLASPAQAATALKKPLKSRTTLPQTMPKPVQVVQPTASTPAPSQYTVVEGDTISAIAGKFGLSTASVLALNGLGWSAVIFPGQVLTLSTTPIAVAATPASVATELTRYTIQPGDTLSGVAAAHGVPTDALFSVNGLGRNSIIFPGQVIVLPAAGSAVSSPATVPASQTTATTASTPGSHTVVAGDTVDKVATGAGVSVKAILEANGLGYSSIIYPGQVLTVPSAASVSAASVVSAPILQAAPAVVITPTPAAAQGSVTPLTAEMAANARLIITVGRQAGASDAALVVALAAAAQESGLRNIDYGDRDSLGLFQQRPSSGWGTEAEVMDAERATRAFFGGTVNPNPGVTRGLLDIPGWEAMTVTQAAQAVQISGHPDLYAKWETSARSWLADLG